MSLSRISTLLKPWTARPLAAAGAVLLIVGALQPWATFVLNEGPYPEKATLQFFDAPFQLGGYRAHVLLFGLAALVVTFVTRIPSRGRVLRALGWGGLAISLVTTYFISDRGGGLGAVTATDGVAAFGGITAIVGGALLVLGAVAMGMESVPEWPTTLPRPAAWGVLLVAFVGVLYLVALTLTAGGIGGASFPYAGPIFVAFLGMAGGLLGALHGLGVTKWISELSERHRAFSIVVLGGLGSAVGVAIAAIVMIGGTELLRELGVFKVVFGPQFDPAQYRMLLFGLAMVCLMVWRPKGLVATREPTVRLKPKPQRGAPALAAAE